MVQSSPNNSESTYRRNFCLSTEPRIVMHRASKEISWTCLGLSTAEKTDKEQQWLLERKKWSRLNPRLWFLFLQGTWRSSNDFSLCPPCLTKSTRQPTR